MLYLAESQKKFYGLQTEKLIFDKISLYFNYNIIIYIII
jgi:hypothetical protein